MAFGQSVFVALQNLGLRCADPRLRSCWPLANETVVKFTPLRSCWPLANEMNANPTPLDEPAVAPGNLAAGLFPP